MVKAKKKKAVHWTKLPRSKLIARAKRLELQVATLRTQLSEARELRLLNERRSAEGQADRLLDSLAPAIEFGYRAGEKGQWNLEMTLHKWANNGLRELDLSSSAMTQRDISKALDGEPTVFPWEHRDDAGPGNNQTECTGRAPHYAAGFPPGTGLPDISGVAEDARLERIAAARKKEGA